MGDRSRNEDLSYPVGATGWWHNGGQSSFLATIPVYSNRTDVARSVTPNGAPRLPLPFETYWSKFQDCPVYAEYWNLPYGIIPASTHDNYPGSFFVQGYDLSFRPIPSNEELDLLGEVREKAVGEFNVPVFLAELGESLGMISGTAKKIAKAATATRKRRYRDAINILWDGTSKGRPSEKRFESPAKAWLEMQYGWKPLYRDLHAAGKDLADHLYAPKVTRVRASRNLEEESEFYTGSTASRVRYRTRLGVTVFVERKVPQVVAALASPWEVLWERIPLSFVVDWAIPIGDYLSAVSLSAELQGTWVYSTKQTAEWTDFRLTPDPNDGGLSVLELKGEFIDRRGRFTREILNFPRIPGPSFKPFDKIASWQHCANALALMTSSLLSIPGLHADTRKSR